MKAPLRAHGMSGGDPSKGVKAEEGGGSQVWGHSAPGVALLPTPSPVVPSLRFLRRRFPKSCQAEGECEVVAVTRMAGHRPSADGHRALKGQLVHCNA